MARRYPYATSADALFRPAQGTDFFEEWDRDRDTMELNLLCAELSRLSYASPDIARPSLARIGFTLGAWIGGESLGQRVSTRGADGFVATSEEHQVTIVAFRGTEPDRLEDLISDVNTLQSPWGDGARVHSGFLKTFNAVCEPLRTALANTRPQLILTGHSLGAALATLAAAEYRERRPVLITFGSPRAGDERFRAILDGLDVRRFVHCCDLVPRVPPARFDAANLGTLIGELSGAGGPSRVVAGVIANILGTAGMDARFEHVGTEMYADQNGVVRPGISEQDRENDQRAARTAYGAPGGSSHAGRLALEALEGARARAAGAVDVLGALRDLVRSAVGAGTTGRLPLRDLADHAPINYVSVFSGRR